MKVDPTDPKSLAAALEYEKQVVRIQREAKRAVDIEERPPHEPLRALTIAELFERPAPSYLIDRLLPEGALAELVGDSESLKSFIAIHMGAVIAGQRDFFGYRVKPGPVLYIAAEGAGAFQFRLRAWGTEHDVDIRHLPFYTIVAPLDLRDTTFQEELSGIVRDVQPVLIVVDTLHRCTPGAEENSSKDRGEVVAFASRLQAERRVTILFIHHPPKNDPAGRGRGSGALYYAADTELSAVIKYGKDNDGGQKIVELAVRKQKDDSKLRFLLTNRIVPVLDDQGRPLCYEDSLSPITSCVLDIATDEDIEAVKAAEDNAEAEDDAATKVKAAEDLDSQIIEYLQAHPDSVKDEIRKAVKAGANKVSKAVDALIFKGTLIKRDERVGNGSYRYRYSVSLAAGSPAL